MADQIQLRHIKIEGYSQTDEYVSPKRGNYPPIKVQDRRAHGSKIREHINRIKEQFDSWLILGIQYIRIYEFVATSEVYGDERRSRRESSTDR